MRLLRLQNCKDRTEETDSHFPPPNDKNYVIDYKR